MSHVVFAGPSLHGVDRPTGLTILPPARQGDLIAAVHAGATRIGLVDGYFGASASVWHKEILYALSQGCRVLGAASMGALRAAECWPFGMEPIGTIAAAYIAGEFVDDADVALLHGPAEFDYVPFTEPLVEVRPTLAALARDQIILPQEADALLGSARHLHFTDRTLDAIVASASLSAPRSAEIFALYEANAIRPKRQDAMLLLKAMKTCQGPSKSTRLWTLSQSPALSTLLSAFQAPDDT